MSNADDRTEDARKRAAVAQYYAEPDQRRAEMRGLFNRTAPYYNLANRLFSLGTGNWYRRFCLRRSGLRSGMVVIDIATGTGLLARAAAALTGDPANVVGVDLAEEMLAIARRGSRVALVQAAAEALPFAPASADFVTMGYGLRHVADLESAFAGNLRILRPGGVMMLLEVSAPRNRFMRAIAAGFIGGLLPRLSWLLTHDARARTLMQYHWQTILSFLPPETVMRVMRASGFEQVRCISHLDLFHHYTGHKPLHGA
jgi:demethylmenaquinone methyltransferase/2-methoxy-6-polyprenyl-1,4-benzoquinol methylase